MILYYSRLTHAQLKYAQGIKSNVAEPRPDILGCKLHPETEFFVMLADGKRQCLECYEKASKPTLTHTRTELLFASLGMNLVRQ